MHWDKTLKWTPPFQTKQLKSISLIFKYHRPTRVVWSSVFPHRMTVPVVSTAGTTAFRPSSFIAYPGFKALLQFPLIHEGLPRSFGPHWSLHLIPAVLQILVFRRGFYANNSLETVCHWFMYHNNTSNYYKICEIMQSSMKELWSFHVWLTPQWKATNFP